MFHRRSMTTETVHPDDIAPLHGVEDPALYESLVESMWAHEWQGRPVLAAEDADGKLQALTGSHRIAAARTTRTHVPVYVVAMTAEQFEAARTDFQEQRLEAVRSTGDAAAIALFELEMKEGR